MRGRGLKLTASSAGALPLDVAPHAGAWIETYHCYLLLLVLSCPRQSSLRMSSRGARSPGYCGRMVVLFPWTLHSLRVLPAAVWRALPVPGFPASALPGGTYSFLTDPIVKVQKNCNRSGRIIFIGTVIIIFIWTVDPTCSGLLDY